MHKALFHGTLVAAKILKTSSAIALGDFRSEIEVLRKVHHPNAVQFLGACTKQEPYILVTGVLRMPPHSSGENRGSEIAGRMGCSSPVKELSCCPQAPFSCVVPT